MPDEKLPESEPEPIDDEIRHSIETPDGKLRIELDQKAGKVTRHDFYLSGKKITQEKAVELLAKAR